MVPTLIAAAVIGALAPFLRGLAWGVPFGLLSVATVLRSAVGAALTVLVLGTVALFALRATSVSADQAPAVAGIVGAIIGLLLLLSSVRRMRRVRGLSVLCQRLREEDAQEAALLALRKLLERARRSDPTGHVSLVLMATGPMTQAGLWSEARDGLLSLDDESMSEPQSVLRNQALATCELQFDEVEAAQRAIDGIRRPTEPSIEVWLVAMEALLMAVGGETERALAHLGGQEPVANPSLEASHRLVHAHVYAARGDDEAAERELRTIEREAGRSGLRRAIQPRGPASALAERIVAELETNQSG